MLVDVAIGVPHICISLVDVILVDPLEVVEQRSHKLFIEQNIFFDFLPLEPDRYAVLGLKEVIDFLLFTLVFGYDSGPADPLEAHEALLLEPKNGRIEEAP